MARVLMSGANGAFGALAARQALNAGHTVAGAMRDAEGRNAAAAQRLRQSGGAVVDIDVTDDESVARGVGAAMEVLGGLDALVNIACVGTHGLAEGYSSDQLLRVLDINLVGVHRMIRAVLPTFRMRKSGLVINLSSLLGRISLPFYGPYSASKWALETLSDTFRVELSQLGVDVVLVEPGGFATSWIDALIRPEGGEHLDSYAAIGLEAAVALEDYEAFLASQPDQDPAKVGQAIVGLIGMPAGHRPARTVVDTVGMAGPVSAVNVALEQATIQVFRNLGADALLKLRSA